MLCFWMKVLSHAGVKKKTERITGFKFGTIIGRFPNVGVSSMAVKMLKLEREACSKKVSVTQTCCKRMAWLWLKPVLNWANVSSRT